MSKSVSELILNHLDDSNIDNCLFSLIFAIKVGLESLGFEIHRIQIPFTQVSGFRHPTHWGIVLTWNDINQFDDTAILLHENHQQKSFHPKNFTAEGILKDSLLQTRLGPFVSVLTSANHFYHQKLDQATLPYDLLEKLRDQGYVDYCALALKLPYSPFPQVMSITSREPFPNNMEELVLPHMSTLSLAIYGAYRTSQAYKLAESYIGPKTGHRVLNGEITRHHVSKRKVGIMFCDIRNFTKLSEELGSTKIVQVMNNIFELIAQAASVYGGEILKFIGDAVLLIFDYEEVSQRQIANNMVTVVEKAIDQLSEYAKKTSLPIAAGFGNHMGMVTYGNIGSKARLDFTVMGPNVNLTSRLESLTKTLDTQALFTESIAQYVTTLVPCGAHMMKGISEPVKVWKL